MKPKLSVYFPLYYKIHQADAYVAARWPGLRFSLGISASTGRLVQAERPLGKMQRIKS